MNDSLGDRIKNNYESRFRSFLPRRTNTIIRIDGKAFHTYTKGCNKPFDNGLIEDMNNTAIALCKQIQGAKFAYVQSDEISIWLTDYDNLQTHAWFDGNIQKICSVSASIATAEFNKLRFASLIKESLELKIISDDNKVRVSLEDVRNFKFANFDSRIFIIPELSEVANYFLWRTQDCSRNSVQMVARSLYSHKECENQNNSELQEMIFQKGQNWAKLDNGLKNGRIIFKGEDGWIYSGVLECSYNFWNQQINYEINKLNEK